MFQILENDVRKDKVLEPFLRGTPQPWVFEIHPIQLSKWLEEAWAEVQRLPPVQVSKDTVWNLVDVDVIKALDFPISPFTPQPPSSGIFRSVQDELASRSPDSEVQSPALWHHLIYAYLLESTGIVDIFAQVIRRIVSGETLGTLTPASLSWARATEQLFFRDPPEFSINGVVSVVRPNVWENRRNAYERFFGFSVPHAIPLPWRSPTVLPDASTLIGSGKNDDFRQKWNELLRQVQIARQNVGNAIGPNPADPTYIAQLCSSLRDMFANRRRGGALAREEFSYVTMLSWFHLTVSSDSPIVKDLQATASSPADRLTAIATRVGLAPAPKSRELFELAEPTSTILRGIEAGLFSTASTAASLYLPTSPAAKDMNLIINNWQSATNERVKDAVVTVVSQPQPVSSPTPGVATATEGAGQPVPAR